MSSAAAAATERRPKIIRLAPIEPKVHYHPLRKAVHAVCFAVFVALPFFDAMRFDIPRQRFYFAGQELWINEFGIIFFALMFLMFLVAAASMLYGRVYCGYLCPQMIFSEGSQALQRVMQRIVERRGFGLRGPARRRLARALFYAVLGVASVFLAFVFISYFVQPRDLLRRLSRLDLATAGGIAGAATTLVTFVDFAFVRQRFCTTVCPYGYLQGLLADDHSLLVQYRDDERICIECGKCVRVCEMGIDIRRSPHQIECIHCGDCIDACADVLGRIGQPGLIHYVWGARGEKVGEGGRAWYRSMLVRDPKRVAVALVLLFYASGLTAALAMRQPVLVQVAPDRSRLFWLADGEVRNRFRLTLANRSRANAFVTFSLDGLNGVTLRLGENPVPLAAGQERRLEFEVSAADRALAPGINPFRIVARTDPGAAVDRFSMTFVMPAEGSHP